MKTYWKWSFACLVLLGALAQSVQANQLKLNVSLGQTQLSAGKPQNTFLKVGLTGFEMLSDRDRTPVNVALVIDRSGSMAGQKIAQARQAAMLAVNRLNKNDIISVIAYSDTVEVLVPATKVSDRQTILQAIERLQAGGSTALFAGVSKGAEEIRKFAAKDKVNRIILLSDGLANVGPSSPSELGDLGQSLGRERISVSTMGLGLQYNEDLMVNLAQRSDGNHAFVENAKDLARIFNFEFGDVLSVVAQDVTVKIRCADGIRPVRLLGRDGEIAGNLVTVPLRQIYGKQERFVMLEVQVASGVAGQEKAVADVEVTYSNMKTKVTDTLTSKVNVRFTEDIHLVEEGENKEVMVTAIQMVANETNKLAMALRSKGQRIEARNLLMRNSVILQDNYKKYNDSRLQKYSQLNLDQSEAVMEDDDSAKYKGARKQALEEQYIQDAQRAW